MTALVYPFFSNFCLRSRCGKLRAAFMSVYEFEKNVTNFINGTCRQLCELATKRSLDASSSSFSFEASFCHGGNDICLRTRHKWQRNSMEPHVSQKAKSWWRIIGGSYKAKEMMLLFSPSRISKKIIVWKNEKSHRFEQWTNCSLVTSMTYFVFEFSCRVFRFLCLL